MNAIARYFTGPLSSLLSRLAVRAITWDQAARAGLVLADSPTAAGVPVTLDSALGLSPVFAGVRLISTAVASLPLVVYRRLDHDDRQRAGGEWAYWLVHDEPNPEMTPFTFWQGMVANQLLHGAMAAEIEFDNAGDPIAMWPLPGNRVEPRRDAGGLFFRVHGNDGKFEDLPPDRVFWVPFLTLDGVTGYGLLRYARETLGLAQAERASAAAYFANMVRPSGALEVPGGFTEQAKANLRASVERVNSGAKATARLMLLEDGVKFNPFALNNSEAQLLESRGFSVQEIARFLGVSPTKLGDLGRATWSNIESENRSFVENTLMPVLCGRDQETNRKLIRRTMRGKLYAESLADARLRGNTAERYASYQVGIQSGFLLRSEARRLENLAWVEGMDKPLVPVAVAQPDTPPAAAAGTTQEPPADANPVA